MEHQSVRFCVVVGLLFGGGVAMGGEEDAAALVKAAEAAIRAGDVDAARAALDRAIEAAPNEPRLYVLRAAVHDQRRAFEAAIDDLSRAIELSGDVAALYHRRGGQHFKLGHMKEAIADFDTAIRLEPRREPGHWQRGIAYYYAGRYDEGRRQFEGYQTVDNNDVENTVWRFLCMARAEGFEQARTDIMPVGTDPRVPMQQVFELFKGTATPDDVLAAATAGAPSPEQLTQRLFYAHLYLGLYYEARGNDGKALEHLVTAAEKHRAGGYMWEVARVHVERLRAAPKQTADD